MVFKLSRMFKRPINKVPAPTLVELPYTPNPGWSHGRAPAGSDTFEDFFGRTITKISVCTYEDPRVPGLSIWRIYAVLDDPNEMIEVEWQLSRHSIPKIMFTYRVTSEIEAELAVANRIDFAIHESPRSRKPYTFYELYLTIIRNGLHTALASKSITSAQFEEFFSTWALTLVGALYRAGRVVPSAVQALAIEIWQSWTQGEVGSCPNSVSARPVAFINTRANEIRDMVCDIMYTSCEF